MEPMKRSPYSVTKEGKKGEMGQGWEALEALHRLSLHNTYVGDFQKAQDLAEPAGSRIQFLTSW